MLSSSKPPVCRFFSSGGCYRSDCKFSHEVQTMTCRFWALGECAKGDACLFRHAFDEQQAESTPVPSSTSSRSSAVGFTPLASPVGSSSLHASPQQSPDTRNLFIDDPMIPDHHRLPSAAATVSVGHSPIPQVRIPTHMPLSIAERLKLKQLTDKYAMLPSSSIEDIFVCTANRNSASTEEILLKMYPHLRAVPPAAPSPSPAPVVPPTRKTVSSKTRGRPVKWVETGEGLNQTYTALREEAIRHAQLRNSYFEQSSNAYTSGNKVLANELARTARSHDEQMTVLHRQAADFIFEKRNTGLGPNVIDLHGLHVVEAIPRLDEFFARVQEGGFRDGYVITGTGHHSSMLSGGKSRLLPAVQEHIQACGYRFENSATDKRGGTTRVYFK